MGAESLFYEAASTALKLIQQALAGDDKAFMRLVPILPKTLQTSMARAMAEAKAKKKLGG
jgi:hypothetical protein